MAERPEGYGMTAEVKQRISSKYNCDMAKEAMEWIRYYVPDADVVDANGNVVVDEEAVHEKLKSGSVLCKLINALQPGSVKKINENKMAFKQMENIGNFLKAVDSFGVNSSESFQTVDLYECQNMCTVITALHALGRKAQGKGLCGIGPKEAEKNVRIFTDEQLKAGANVIGLQMGSNKGASQSGQNFGKARSIID